MILLRRLILKLQLHTKTVLVTFTVHNSHRWSTVRTVHNDDLAFSSIQISQCNSRLITIIHHYYSRHSKSSAGNLINADWGNIAICLRVTFRFQVRACSYDCWLYDIWPAINWPNSSKVIKNANFSTGRNLAGKICSVLDHAPFYPNNRSAIKKTPARLVVRGLQLKLSYFFCHRYKVYKAQIVWLILSSITFWQSFSLRRSISASHRRWCNSHRRTEPMY